MHLSEQFFYCYCVLHRPYYFRYHLQKVQDDVNFIKYLFDNNKLQELQFMENYYRDLLKDSAAQKDIMTRKWFKQLREEND